MSVEIVIDPNVRTEGGLTYAGFEDVTGGFVFDLEPGDRVTVVEEESDVVGWATIDRIEPGRRLMYLAVDWSSLHRRVPSDGVIADADRFMPMVKASYLTPSGPELDSSTSSTSRSARELVDLDL